MQILRTIVVCGTVGLSSVCAQAQHFLNSGAVALVAKDAAEESRVDPALKAGPLDPGPTPRPTAARLNSDPLPAAPSALRPDLTFGTLLQTGPRTALEWKLNTTPTCMAGCDEFGPVWFRKLVKNGDDPWKMAEGFIDAKLLTKIETRSSPALTRILRVALNPSHTGRNLLRFKSPWFRERDRHTGAVSEAEK